MDKYVIASDIHGSAKYCRMLMDLYEKVQPDKLILLGDLLYHGPRNDLPDGYQVKEVFAMLNGLKDEIIAVRGNCDCEVDQMVLEFPMMEDNKPLELDGVLCFVNHGHVYNTVKPMPIGMGQIMLAGHTHIPACQKAFDYIYMNPGSVSIPKAGSAHSAMVYENGTFSWIDLETMESYKQITMEDLKKMLAE